MNTHQLIAQAAAQDAATCPLCESNLRYPIDWQSVGKLAWIAELRCPNCLAISHKPMREDAVQVFDELLDCHTDEIVKALRDLTYSNMATEIKSFTAALEKDLIQPFDF